MNCGFRSIEIEDHKNKISFNCKVLYPSQDVSGSVSFGPYSLDAVTNGQLAEGRFPLVIISHGNGGTALVYRNIAQHLASHGYVVAMPEHYGNNRMDNSLSESIDNLIFRPYHLHLVIETLLGDSNFSNDLLADKIAVIGHSFGGYTALALAGGNPSTREGVPIEVQHDTRVKAIVLMAPAAGWFFGEGALDSVQIPVSLWMGELDHITPRQWSSEIVLNGIPDKSKIENHVVPLGGHFSFLTPFPESMKSPNFPPSTDPAGFDREEFHKRFPSQIEEFLQRVL
jgi:predicted dienelactone hydrolase